MKRKAAALILGLCMLCSLLAGCKVEFPVDAAELDSLPEGVSSAVSSAVSLPEEAPVVSESSSSQTESQEPQGAENSKANSSAVNSSVKASDAPQGQKDPYQTEPTPTGQPKPTEPQDTPVNEDKKMTCTISIRCDTLLKDENFNKLPAGKQELVPADGAILTARTVEFSEGESVFDVLLRETRKRRIHMEFVKTPVYNSNYIKGIHNLYEKEAGDLSGWMYKVNGWFPNYGCSRYSLKDGDVIEWVYTCDLGRDVGNEWSEGWQE